MRRSIVPGAKEYLGRMDSQDSIRSRQTISNQEIFLYFNELIAAIDNPGSVTDEEIDMFFKRKGFPAVAEFLFSSFEVLASSHRADLMNQVLDYYFKHDPRGITIESQGYNFFHLAAIHKMPEIVPLLARVSSNTLRQRGSKTRINRPSSSPEFVTPLMIAVANNDEKTAQVLIENGADLWQVNAHHDSPLSYALGEENRAFRNRLREIAYNAEPPKKKGFFAKLFSGKDHEFPAKFTPKDLHELAQICDSKKKNAWVDFLDERGVWRDNSFFERIMELVEFDSSTKGDVVKVITHILKIDLALPQGQSSNYGALIGFNRSSDNLFHMAAKYGIHELVEPIYEVQKEKINDLNREGKSALKVAEETGNMTVFDELMAFGARPGANPRNDDALSLNENDIDRSTSA